MTPEYYQELVIFVCPECGKPEQVTRRALPLKKACRACQYAKGKRADLIRAKIRREGREFA